MTTIFLRRRGLGATSCNEMSAKMITPSRVVRHDLGEWSVTENDIVVRWGCTANIPGRTTIINTARAIHQVNNKPEFRKTLMEAAPELIPTTYFSSNEVPVYKLTNGLVVRPGRHSQGRHVHIVHTQQELYLALSLCGDNPYISDIIDKVAEYRVCVAQGKAVWVAQKTPGDPEAFAWNVARGGRFDNVRWGDWNLRVVRTAIEAFNLSELDFGGVDVIVDGEGEAYVLEINSAPSMTSPYRQQCMANVFDWISEHGKQRIPMIQERGGYRKFIHPAICNSAILVEE